LPSSAKQVRSAGPDKIYDPTEALGEMVEVTIQNLGPNALYLDTGDGGAGLTTASGLQVPPDGAYTTDGLDEVWAIAATALQASPLDTRVSIERKYR
jgi:hypothetical protein